MYEVIMKSKCFWSKRRAKVPREGKKTEAELRSKRLITMK